MDQLIQLLPSLYEPCSNLSRRQRVARAFRLLSGASSCLLRAVESPVRLRMGHQLVRLPIGTVDGSEHEARLYLETGRPPPDPAVLEALAGHVLRVLALPEVSPSPVEPMAAPVVVMGALGDLQGAVVLRQSRNDELPWPEGLTAAQRRICELAALGYSHDDIGARLGISSSTVANQLNQAFEVMGLASKHELSLWLLEQSVVKQ